MIANRQDVEKRLMETYRRQAAGYALVLGHAERLLAAWPESADATAAAYQLSALVSHVAPNSDAVEQLWGQWAQGGQKASPQLAAAWQDVVRVLGELVQRIRKLEQLATERKQRLVPELDVFARGWQMQRAYSAGAGV